MSARGVLGGVALTGSAVPVVLGVPGAFAPYLVTAVLLAGIAAVLGRERAGDRLND